MNFIFITLFENLVKPYFGDSILKRAVEKNLIKTHFFNPREFTTNRYKKVDEYMIGGGAGLLMQCEPLANTIKEVNSKFENVKFIYLTPVGKKFTQNDAKRLSKLENLCFICGRYEGIDERIIEKYVNEVFCIGDFVLTGGELPALCMCDSIARNLKGVLGNESSLLEESFENELLEAPSFAKPDNFENFFIISEFLKGNHAKIQALKFKLANSKTRFFRPDMFRKIKDRQNKGKL